MRASITLIFTSALRVIVYFSKFYVNVVPLNNINLRNWH